MTADHEMPSVHRQLLMLLELPEGTLLPWQWKFCLTVRHQWVVAGTAWSPSPKQAVELSRLWREACDPIAGTGHATQAGGGR